MVDNKESVVIVHLMNNQGNLIKVLAVCKDLDRAKKYVMDRIKEEQRKYDYPEPKIRYLPCKFYGAYVEADFESPDFGPFTINYCLIETNVIQ